MKPTFNRKLIHFESRGETLPATLYDTPSNTSSAGVVLCPPHPLYGGNRNDTRIVKVAIELAAHNISALCIDYGSYGKGVKEVQNVTDAISFMRKRASFLGLLGYSFGAVVASNAATRVKVEGFVAMSILNKVNDLAANLAFDCPKLFVHGKHDNVAPYSDLESLFKEARGRKQKLLLDTDHFYMDNYPTMIGLAAENIRRFFENVCFI